MLLDSFSANIETLNAFFSFWHVYAHTYGLKKGKGKVFHFKSQVHCVGQGTERGRRKF